MNVLSTGAMQTFICDPGERVRECLREVKRQRESGRKIVSEEEITSGGYKFIENKALPTILVMHQFL